MIQDGTAASVYVQALQGDAEKWDRWPEIRRVNPLVALSADFRRKLIEERDAARRDSRLKARFLSCRLNVPTGDESTMLLTVDDWERVTARPVAGREGRPIVGVDLGGGRAWSAAVAIWQTGRCEALAVAPGIPSLAEQEKRDRVPAGTYRALADRGALCVAEGLRVQPPGELIRAALEAWGAPELIVCDRFRLGELQDSVSASTPVLPRVARWSEAGVDIRALRKVAADGPLSCVESSRLLVAASLAFAVVKNDDQGNVRLSKRGTNNTARDDVAAALVLAAGGSSGPWNGHGNAGATRGPHEWRRDMEYVIPAVIVLIGNVFSGAPGSRQWETVTALFGWVACIAITLWLLCLVLGWVLGWVLGLEFWARHVLFPIWIFCLLQALSRDYEKFLKPLADRWLRRRNQTE